MTAPQLSNDLRSRKQIKREARIALVKANQAFKGKPTMISSSIEAGEPFYMRNGEPYFRDSNGTIRKIKVK